MRTLRYLTLFSILLLAFAFSASAQRTRRTTPRPTPKPTPVRNTVNADVTAAKEKVANQLHNVNIFVDIMGPVAISIEANDKDAAARRLKKEQMDANDLNKRKLIAAIRNLRDGLAALETDFRTKPILAQYLSKIQGISALSTQSEDSAIAGRFVAAKDPLRQIAVKLNDTLVVLPGPMPAGSSPVSAAPRTLPASTQSRPVSTTPSSTTVGKRVPIIGMTTTEVLQSTWGTPASKRTSKTANGTTEVWNYSGKRTVYFYNGRVSNVVQ